MEIRKIFVAGAGQMGNGIAQVAAQAGYQTVMMDVKQEFVDKGMANIKKNLQRQVDKSKMTLQEMDQIISKLIPTTDIKMASEADVVIEAIPENEALKKQFMIDLDQVTPEHTILASNTSAIPITVLGSVTKRPAKVVGMHFMNPVPVMRIVEIVQGNQTSEETIAVIKQLAADFKKESILAKDFPGFLSTRLSMALMNEALYALYEGRGTMEDIDKCAKLALNHPMGPFEWLDFVGLDSVLSILTNLWESFAETRYFPCPLLKQMVQAGRLGRKSGKGFYDYQ
ncbi:MAG: 3-hydroxyacyl-CoA dehydrogenase NAD-binding domain-containing protein [Thermincola sp.]|jgi:3-hydroxybutyryl-CoA dehydrogenase|nr:3-hydroxyacyl-CoA dehydrogenase NAD-binding domain-containing protein [Thermincola sp.]MDT3704979.1 3-hydroxyacyl-CoA dehydrogenase NAD-binding domain-containing protein [Thermincola sp.]